MKNRVGNILEVEKGLIIHQVNAQGVMGSGVAGALRGWYPRVFKDYADVVGPEYTQPNSGRDLLGRVIFTQATPDLVIASLIGQQFFGRDKKRYTSYDALDTGLKSIADLVGGSTIDIHHPLIGCGLGGGEWKIVKSIIEHHLGYETTLWELDPQNPARVA